MQSFTASVEAFEEANRGLLTPSDSPALTMLYSIADEMDRNGMQVALVSAFGVAFRALQASLDRRAGAADVDEVDALIDQARS